MVTGREDPDELAAENGPAAAGGKDRKGKPPFQLCFAAAQEQGRSILSRPKLPGNACIITPKFYSSVDGMKIVDDEMVLELAQEIEKLRNCGPRDKYSEPLLESHSYGWYPEPLVPTIKIDRRFNHHKMTSDMVKVQSILDNANRAEKDFQQHLNSRKTKKE